MSRLDPAPVPHRCSPPPIRTWGPPASRLGPPTVTGQLHPGTRWTCDCLEVWVVVRVPGRSGRGYSPPGDVWRRVPTGPKPDRVRHPRRRLDQRWPFGRP